jgi:phosphoserine phosphatase RsbU/P
MTQLSLPKNATLAQLNTLCQELVQLNHELTDRNNQIEKELYTTRQLQQSLLPPFLEEDGFYGMARVHYKDANLRISGVYLPCDSVGGDLYDVVNFNNNGVGVCLADVSGHGVPASFITALFKASFYRTTHNYQAPGDILYHLNNELIDMIKTGDYITALYCRVQDEGRRLEYAGAGHPYPLHYRAADNTVTPLPENGTPLVWFQGMDYATGHIALAPGDKVLAFTDGVTEMQTAQDELYGEERLKTAFLDAVAMADEQPILDTLLSTLSDFAQGHPLADDFSMVLIEKSSA